MPEQKPVSRIISTSKLVRSEIRCASSSLSSLLKNADPLLQLCQNILSCLHASSPWVPHNGMPGRWQYAPAAALISPVSGINLRDPVNLIPEKFHPVGHRCPNMPEKSPAHLPAPGTYHAESPCHCGHTGYQSACESPHPCPSVMPGRREMTIS